MDTGSHAPTVQTPGTAGPETHEGTVHAEAGAPGQPAGPQPSSSPSEAGQDRRRTRRRCSAREVGPCPGGPRPGPWPRGLAPQGGPAGRAALTRLPGFAARAGPARPCSCGASPAGGPASPAGQGRPSRPGPARTKLRGPEASGGWPFCFIFSLPV